MFNNINNNANNNNNAINHNKSIINPTQNTYSMKSILTNDNSEVLDLSVKSTDNISSNHQPEPNLTKLLMSMVNSHNKNNNNPIFNLPQLPINPNNSSHNNPFNNPLNWFKFLPKAFPDNSVNFINNLQSFKKHINQLVNTNHGNHDLPSKIMKMSPQHFMNPHSNESYNNFYQQHLLQSRLLTGGFSNTNSTNPNNTLSPDSLFQTNHKDNIKFDTFHHTTPSHPNNSTNSHFDLHNILKSSTNRKRKRTKVTDTRLPRKHSNILHSTTTNNSASSTSSMFPIFPTNKHYPPNHQCNSSQNHNNDNLINLSNNNNNNIGVYNNFLSHSPVSDLSNQSDELTGDPKKYTLTPIHLRKAKLMFLYTRYPNSQMLKSYFPDITFYKQNTAQLVKWFSNFREFYYSEMEKTVQRAMSNGIKSANDLDVTLDSELFKNLMTHFNKKKQIVVPCEFLTTVQITIREFFEAISTGKHLHQSWKKPIYKNIAKLDQQLPDFFKDMGWMMELAKEENEN